MTWCKKMLILRHSGHFSWPRCIWRNVSVLISWGHSKCSPGEWCYFSDVSIMRAVSSARSSCLCWKERCIETEYIVIILLPTSLFLSSYKGQWTELRLSANTYRRGEEEDLPVLLFCFYVSVWFCCCNYSVFISSVYLLWMVPSYLWINISPLENSTWVV